MKGLKDNPAYKGCAHVLRAQSCCSLWTWYSPALAAGSIAETAMGFSMPRNSKLGEKLYIQGKGPSSQVLFTLTQPTPARPAMPGGETSGKALAQLLPLPSPAMNRAKEQGFSAI